MECGPVRMCELLVGLGEVDVLGIGHGVGGEPLMLHVRCRAPRPLCAGCGGGLWSDGGRAVVLVDLPSFGRPGEVGVAQAQMEMPQRRLRDGLGDTAEPSDRAAAGVVGDAGREVGDPPSRSGSPCQRCRSRVGVLLVSGEPISSGVGSRFARR